MLQTVEVLPGSRRSLRRAVHVACELISTFWDEPVPHLLTDLSEEGLFVNTPFPLTVGEQVYVCLTPPRWGGARELLVAAAVRRVELRRRASEVSLSGMGLEFLDLEERDRRALSAALRGLPPPLRRARQRLRDELVWVDMLLTWEEDLGDRVNTFEVSEHIGPVRESDFEIEPLAEPIELRLVG